jgi:uncharacterized protein YgfB (UPF0149 family)
LLRSRKNRPIARPCKGLEDIGVDEDHPDDEEDVENYSDVEEYVEELSVAIFIVFVSIFLHSD